jgi:hypothetical protein
MKNGQNIGANLVVWRKLRKKLLATSMLTSGELSTSPSVILMESGSWSRFYETVSA